jgi:hypothetical protein
LPIGVFGPVRIKSSEVALSIASISKLSRAMVFTCP